MAEASKILELQKKWKLIDKDTIMDNVEDFLIHKYPECRGFETKLKILMDITNSKKQTVYAWVNRSRKDVKIPFLKLCKIAEDLGLDMESLLDKK